MNFYNKHVHKYKEQRASVNRKSEDVILTKNTLLTFQGEGYALQVTIARTLSYLILVVINQVRRTTTVL